ncbi:hypothetical protein D918_07056, partial [Trichuris suis]
LLFSGVREDSKSAELTGSQISALTTAYKSFKKNVNDCFVDTCYSIFNSSTTSKQFMPRNEYRERSKKCKKCLQKCQKQHIAMLKPVEHLVAMFTHYKQLSEFDGLDKPDLALSYWKKFKDDPFKVASDTIEYDMKIIRKQVCT